MASWNEHTGDPLVSRVLSKEGEEAFEQIFGKRKTNGGWTPPPLVMPVDTPNQLTEYAEDWQSTERDRAIAQNGNTGEHYEEIK